MSKRSNKSNSNKIWQSLNTILLVIYLILACYFLFLVFRYHILAFSISI